MEVHQELAIHLGQAAALNDYEAVDHLYQGLVKASRRYSGDNEGARLISMLDALAVDDLRRILDTACLDELLDLDPPLETVLTDSTEELRTEEIAAAIAGVREHREANPKNAVRHLAIILKRIRDKRYHGFKSIKGHRDTEILAAARGILCELAEAVRGLLEDRPGLQPLVEQEEEPT